MHLVQLTKPCLVEMILYALITIILLNGALLDVFSNVQTCYPVAYRILYLFACLYLIALAGLRACGVDFEEYLNMYDLIRDINLPTEPGYAILNYLFSYFGWVVLTMAILSMIPKINVFLTLSPYPILSLFLLLSPWFFVQDMGQYRQAVATSFCLLSTLYFNKPHRPKAYFLLLTAILFHYSALFFIPALFVSKTPYSIRKILLFLVGSILIGSSIMKLIPALNNYLPGYLNNKIELYTQLSVAEGGIFTISLAVKLFLYCLIYWKKDRIIQLRNGGLYINLYFISFCLLLLFSPFPTFAGRSGLSYKITELILIPYLIKSTQLFTNKLLLTCFVLFVFLYGIVNFMLSVQGSYIPYKTWLNGI